MHGKRSKGPCHASAEGKNPSRRPTMFLFRSARQARCRPAAAARPRIRAARPGLSRARDAAPRAPCSRVACAAAPRGSRPGPRKRSGRCCCAAPATGIPGPPASAARPTAPGGRAPAGGMPAGAAMPRIEPSTRSKPCSRKVGTSGAPSQRVRRPSDAERAQQRPGAHPPTPSPTFVTPSWICPDSRSSCCTGARAGEGDVQELRARQRAPAPASPGGRPSRCRWCRS